ncbi:MAG: hypothetical protein ABEJ31_05445 [Haloarculaceae archaeon]
MGTAKGSRSSAGSRGRRRRFPANGPLDALLGYALFYLLVDRATPTVVDVFATAVPDLEPALLRFGLAALLWFVLAVTVIDQARRQYAALTGTDDDGWSVVEFIPVETRWLGSLGLAVVGGAIAAATFDRAVETAVSLIPVVATLDVGAFDPVAVAVLVVFFVAFDVASTALDRLVLGGIRALLES